MKMNILGSGTNSTIVLRSGLLKGQSGARQVKRKDQEIREKKGRDQIITDLEGCGKWCRLYSKGNGILLEDFNPGGEIILSKTLKLSLSRL